MRALLTGATGMIGANLSRRLVGEGWHVAAMVFFGAALLKARLFAPENQRWLRRLFWIGLTVGLPLSVLAPFCPQIWPGGIGEITWSATQWAPRLGRVLEGKVSVGASAQGADAARSACGPLRRISARCHAIDPGLFGHGDLLPANL